MLPTQPACSVLAVGSMTIASGGVAQRRLALEQRRQRALDVRQLLARGRRRSGSGAPASASSIITASAPFMSAAPRPCTASSVAAARAVVLGGDGVEVAGEDDSRAARRRRRRSVSPASRDRARRRRAGRRGRARPGAPRRATPRGRRSARACVRRGARRASAREAMQVRPSGRRRSKFVALVPIHGAMAALRRSPVARFSLISLVDHGGARRRARRACSSAGSATARSTSAAAHRRRPRRDRRPPLRLARTSCAPGCSRDHGRAQLDEHLQSGALRAHRRREGQGLRRAAATLVYSDDGEGARHGRARARSNVAVALGGRTVKSGRARHVRHRQGRADAVGLRAAALPGRAEPRRRLRGLPRLRARPPPPRAATRSRCGRSSSPARSGCCGSCSSASSAASRRALRRQVDENRRQATHDALTGLPNRTLLFERLGDAVDAGAGRAAPARPRRLPRDQRHARPRPRRRAARRGRRAPARRRRRGRPRRPPRRRRVRGPAPRRAAEDRGARARRAPRRRAARAARRPRHHRRRRRHASASRSRPQHGDDASTLARRAEVAMYQAQAPARRRRASTTPTRDHHNRGRLELLGELGAAMRRDELVLAYQPKIDLATGAVRGVEALVRWQHPEHGLLSPGAFIPAAEVTSLVRPLTLYVVDAALRAHRAWADAGLELPVAVNLAGPCVMDVGDARRDRRPARRPRRHPAELLTLEISERTMMSDINRALRVLDGPARPRRAPLARRLRHRPDLARPAAPAAAARDEDRPLAGHRRRAPARLGRRDRPHVRPAGRRRGRRDAGDRRRAASPPAATRPRASSTRGRMWADEVAAWVAERELASAA